MAKNQAPDAPPALWEYSDVAEYAGVAERTVQEWVAQGRGPRSVRLGRNVRFRVADVAAWVDKLAVREPA